MSRWRGDPEVPRALRVVLGALGAGVVTALLFAPFIEAHAEGVADRGTDARAVWRAALPRTPIDTVTAVTTIPGLVEIVSGSKIFYGDTAGKVLLLGNLYDVRANRDLTQERADALAAGSRRPWSVPPPGAITIGNGPADTIVFMDPHCGWCRKLHAELAATTSLRAHLLMLPLSDAALPSAQSVLCHQHPAAALARLYAGETLKPVTCAAADRAIATARALANTYGINATPATVARDGRMRLGYQPLPATLTWLAATGTEPSTDLSTEVRTP